MGKSAGELECDHVGDAQRSKQRDRQAEIAKLQAGYVQLNSGDRKEAIRNLVRERSEKAKDRIAETAGVQLKQREAREEGVKRRYEIR